MNDTTKAWGVGAYGPVESIALIDYPVARPGAGEVLIDVAAMALNPLDLKLMSGQMKDFMPVDMPFVPGSDVTGTVVAVGDGVDGLTPGQPIVASSWNGALARRALLPASAHVVAVPATANLHELAALPMAGLTARNILRNLTALGCKVTVLPATAAADDVLRRKPDGVFLSNGPGDPAATGEYAVPMIKEVVASGVPTFGICLGHQMLALALGAETEKMHLGHHGANHPIKDLTTGKVEITSQNHGFVVKRESLPAEVEETHFSLFDKSLAGIRLKGRPVFSVQYHPEASPGPQDSHYLFKRFVEMMEAAKAGAA